MVWVITLATIAVFFGLVVAPVARVLEESGDLPGPLVPMFATLKRLEVWHVAGLMAVGAVLVAPHQAAAALVVFGVLFAAAWFREFLCLMGRRDDEFPGRFDKPLWAFALIVAGPFGVLAFRTFRAAHWPADERVGRRAMEPAASAEPL